MLSVLHSTGQRVARLITQRRGRHRSSRVPRHAPEDTDGWISTTLIGSGFVGIMSGTGRGSGPPTRWTGSRSRRGYVSGASSAPPTGVLWRKRGKTVIGVERVDHRLDP